MGKNKIRVKAFDIKNASSSKAITIYREAERGEIWAAVIGINTFKDSAIPSLKYARNDAQAFAHYLRENIGLDNTHFFALYDDEATMVNLLSLLGTKLRRKAKKAEDTGALRSPNMNMDCLLIIS